MDASLIGSVVASPLAVSMAGWGLVSGLTLATVAGFCLIVRADVMKAKRRAAQLRRHRRR